MAFDSAIVSFTTKTDKVDLVQAAHINAVQSELVTIETILGVGVKGNRINLASRLNNAIDPDGSILSGTAFPSPSFISQLFYRTDLITLYIKNPSGGFDALGSSLSNVIFQWTGMGADDVTVDANSGIGFIFGSTASPAMTLTEQCIIGCAVNITQGTVLRSKWTKISGVSTITFKARTKTTSGTGKVGANVGGQTGNATFTDTSYTWQSFTVDVSSLVNGTVYDLTVLLGNNNANNYMTAVVGLGS